MIYSNVVQYFDNLSQCHRLLGADSEKEHFLEISFEELFRPISRPGTYGQILVLFEHPDFSVSDNGGESFRELTNFAFSVVQPPQPDDPDRHNKIAVCHQIAMDMLGRLYSERGHDPANWKHRFKPGSIKGQVIGPLSDNNYGVRVEFRIDPSTTLNCLTANWADL